MDADLSHDPAYLPDLVASLTDHDLVIGSRYMNGVSVINWPLHRIVLSAFANRYIRFVTGLAPQDCTSGFRVWRREALAPAVPGKGAGQRVRVPDRDAVRSRAPRLPHRRSADRVRRTAEGLLEGVAEGAMGIAADAVATILRGGRLARRA